MSRNIPTKITLLKNITQISCGGYHSIVLNNDHKTLYFGSNFVILFLNKNGQLGIF
jgi:alpha-tubulin suppressor-like RCC1 family protein